MTDTTGRPAVPLTGRVAWVTGGSSGIGRATVDALRRDGAAVGIVDLQPPGDDVPFAECELADSGSVAAATAALRKHTGAPDILVNNAGVTAIAPISELSDEQWHHVLDVNLSGAFFMTRAVLGSMIERRWGRIVSVTSTTAIRVTAGRAAYAASKAGLIALTKTAAAEGAPHGVTANVVAPGVVDTPMTRAKVGDRAALEASVRGSALANPMNVVLEPHDIAHAIRFLVHPDSRYITGELIFVNAGAFMA